MSSEKSAYALYCETRNIKILGTTLDAPLFDLTQDAAKKARVTHSAWVRDVLAQAVRDAGFEYTAPTKTNLQAQLQAQADEIAELRAQLAAAKAPIVPTPPAEKANEKGEIVQK